MAEEPLIKDLAGKAQESSSTEFHLDHIYANCIDVHPIKKTSFHSEYWNRVVDLLQFNRDDNPTAVYLEAPTPPADMILHEEAMF